MRHFFLLFALLCAVAAAVPYAGCTGDTALSVCTVNGVCSPSGACVCLYGWATEDALQAPHCTHKLRTQEGAWSAVAFPGGVFGVHDAYLGYTGWALARASAGFFSIITAVCVAVVFFFGRAVKALFSCATRDENAATAAPLAQTEAKAGDAPPAASPVMVSIEARSPTAVLKPDALIPERCMSTPARRRFARATYAMHVANLALLVGLLALWIADQLRIAMGWDLKDAQGFPVLLWNQ